MAQNAFAQDPWAWNQMAQAQDPDLYGWKDSRAIKVSDLGNLKPALQQAGKWDSAWDALMADPYYANDPGGRDPGQPIQAADLSALDGYTNAHARAEGYNRLSGYFGPDGQRIEGSGVIDEGNGTSMRSKDWRNYVVAAAAMTAGGYGAASLAGTVGAGAAGAGATAGTGAMTASEQIAMMAANGMTDAQIATALGTAGAEAGGLAGVGAGAGSIPYTAGAADAQLPSSFSGFENVGAQQGGMDYSSLYNGGDLGGYGGADMGSYGDLSGLGNAGGGGMDYSSLYNGGNAGGFGGADLGSYGGAPSGSPTDGGGSKLGKGLTDFFTGNSSTDAYLRAAGTVGSLYATNQASKAAQQGEANNQALLGRMYDQNRADNQPLLDMRNQTLPRINALMKDPSSVSQEPGYQFGLKQGQDQIDNSMAARGGYYSGQQMKASQRYGQDYAGTKLDQSLNRLMGVAGLGQVGAAANQSNNNNYGQNAGQSMVNSGNNRGSGYIGYGNTLNNGINNYMQDSYFDQWAGKKRGG